jgi:hypothetical protein
MAGKHDRNHPYSKLSVAVDVTDNFVQGDEDGNFDSQEDLSPQTTRTVTQQVLVSEELTTAQGPGQVTGQVTEQFYASKESTAPKAAGNATGQSAAPQKVTVSQATGTITEQLPASNEVKQLKIAGQVTEVTASQEASGTTTEQFPDSKEAKQTKIAGQVTEVSTSQELRAPQVINPDGSGYQTPASGIGSSTPRSNLSIRKAIISAVLDGSPFKSSSSHNETKPLRKNSGELNRLDQTIPQPKPRSQTAADPPRPPMLGYEWVWFPAGYWAEREIIARPTRTIRPPKWVRRSLQESTNNSSYSSQMASAQRSLNASEVWLKNPSDLAEEAEDDMPQRRRASTPPGRLSPDMETSAPKNIFRRLQQISHSRKASASGSSANKGKVC